MSDKTQGREEQETYDNIELYFDLEQASESSDSENIGEHLSGFTPITRRKEDPFKKWLIEVAEEEEHASGGKGPFVFPHSSSVFMGIDDQATKEPVEEADSTPLELPIHTQTPLSFAYDLHSQGFGGMPQGPFTYTRGYPNWTYNPQIQRVEATMHSPPIYTQQQPNWVYTPQNHWIEPTIQTSQYYTQKYLNPYDLQTQGFEVTPPRLPYYTQQQNSAYYPQMQRAAAMPQGPFTYAHSYPDSAYGFRNQTYRYVM
ncbi:hypothetical protein F5Y12DRAFT_800022 [Xylaria sp. FL1777]|nr:hypothetical protein F5Y12DRAFT_800022 [Xylaria sp. FL1777]